MMNHLERVALQGQNQISWGQVYVHIVVSQLIENFREVKILLAIYIVLREGLLEDERFTCVVIKEQLHK